MIVTFISQCEKKAIHRTRRVLDAFANRIGDNTWQTVITEDGLLAVKRMLLKTVSKSTAVACHRIATRRYTELVWVVGNKNKFNKDGVVPVNTTQKDVFMDVMTMKPKKDEFYANTHLQPLAEHLFAVGYIAHQLFKRVVGNDEHVNLEKVAFLAGCLHDLGKLDPLFQDWVKKGKQKNPQEDGQHIDVKFTFDKHPRHNEISLMLFNIFENQCNTLNRSQKIALQHVIYWHHAKPYRKEENFIGVFNAYEYLNKNVSQEQFEEIVKEVLKLLNRIHALSQHYSDKSQNIQIDLPWGIESINDLVEDFSYNFKNTVFPEFKDYKVTDEFPALRQKININAQHNLLRACVISADRLISSLTAVELCERIQEHRLDELLDNQESLSSLVSHIENALSRFPKSARTKKQSEVAEQLADLSDIAVLSGAAGCGKTKIALEWAKYKNAKKIFWVCPRVQVCQGIFEELISTYLPDANIEIFTGEFKFTNSWDKTTKEKNYFSGDVVVTTIDQILGSVTTHTNVNGLIPFVDAHVIFDEYHEYIDMEIFNLLFAELVFVKKMRKNYDKRLLLVSATPHYSFLKEILNLDANEDVVEMPSFNQSLYEIQFIDYDETISEKNPFYQAYDNKTFIISNTAKTAQLGFLYKKDQEKSILFHSKYKRSDKKKWFNEVYESFKKDGSNQYDILRSGPIVQASLNISCDHMLVEMSSPENILQRLGRLDRFGQNSQINTLNIAVTDHIKQGKQVGSSAKFLARLHGLQSAKAWYLYLNEYLGNKPFKLAEIYKIYKDFYNSVHVEKEIQQDLKAALKSSIMLLNAKVTEPVKVLKVKSDDKKIKISKNSLRGDNRFVQMAVLDVNNYKNPIFKNEYAYQLPVIETEEFDNLTESTSLIKDLGLLNFIAQKHGNIDPTHPVKGIPEKKMTFRNMVLENYARDAEYPLYLSYIEDDLNKVGGAGIRYSEAIYYAVCDQQPIGAISIQLIKELNNVN
ncbi:CRISPR-associated helicase Cas3' [uncultured Acinetobacter sp.]|uniref:CRISPR-associated helicase Cas3' n=1 Tax=uncultured Acinetobacter sp. TaxID=165433 RepID=UPI00258C6252|nr:CRISPR-associated helicase Cas3' [uncultured Acinetobacter sp.]